MKRRRERRGHERRKYCTYQEGKWCVTNGKNVRPEKIYIGRDKRKGGKEEEVNSWRKRERENERKLGRWCWRWWRMWEGQHSEEGNVILPEGSPTRLCNSIINNSSSRSSEQCQDLDTHINNHHHFSHFLRHFLFNTGNVSDYLYIQLLCWKVWLKVIYVRQYTPYILPLLCIQNFDTYFYVLSSV